jgi:hypothetical protein
MIHEIRAEMELALVAVLSKPFPLAYSGGGSREQDYPAFVRAASAIRRWHGQRVIVQDDVNVLASSDGAGPAADAGLEPVLLPRGEGGRRSFDDTEATHPNEGNKRFKLDLEAALVLPDGRLLAFGSGSLPARERLVLLEPGKPPELREAHDLYAALRRRADFAGSELNIEGAIVRSGAIELFQRGNGRVGGELEPVNAVGRLGLAAFLCWLDAAAPPPELEHVLRIDLGRQRGVPLGFTDAALRADGSVAFLACAEASPDAVADGEVVCTRLGLLDPDRAARLIDIHDEHGRPCLLKLEGIDVRPDDPDRFDVVADVDDPRLPALGATLAIMPR